MDHVARAARVAADPDAAPRARVAALVAVVEAVSLHGLAIPDVIADALDDATLIDTAIATKQTAAVCAALHQLGRRPDLETTRRRVVRKLVAAGAGGTNLADLAFQIGDLAAGANLAVRDYHDHIVSRLGDHVASVDRSRVVGDPVVEAWLTWLADQSDAAATAVLRMLTSRGVSIAMLLAHADRQRAERLSRLAIGSPTS
jgi:hypothetical protein